MVSRIILSLVLVASICSASNNDRLVIRKDKLFVPSSLSGSTVEHSEGRFHVSQDGEKRRVENNNMSRELRSINAHQVKSLLSGGYLKVDRSINGDYKLDYNARLKGGGILGAKIGFWAGKLFVHGLGHLVMFGVSSLTGLAAPATMLALRATFLVPLEAASNVVGLGCGIAAGAATGPV